MFRLGVEGVEKDKHRYSRSQFQNEFFSSFNKFAFFLSQRKNLLVWFMLAENKPVWMRIWQDKLELNKKDILINLEKNSINRKVSKVRIDRYRCFLVHTVVFCNEHRDHFPSTVEETAYYRGDRIRNLRMIRIPHTSLFWINVSNNVKKTTTNDTCNTLNDIAQKLPFVVQSNVTYNRWASCENHVYRRWIVLQQSHYPLRPYNWPKNASKNNYLLVIQCGKFIGLITAPDVNLGEKWYYLCQEIIMQLKGHHYVVCIVWNRILTCTWNLPRELLF